jgi:hypothetical protein
MEGWKKKYNEELHIVYSLQIMIMMIKSKRIRWVRCVARVEG